MATLAGKSYLRAAQRTDIQWSPTWISSAEVSAADSTGKAALLLEFSEAGRVYLIHSIAVQIVTAITGTLNISQGTIGASYVDGDNVTYGTTADYVATASITEATPGFYTPAAAGSLTFTKYAAGTMPTITGSASARPCCVGFITSGSAGSYRVHMCVSEIPGI